MSARRPVAQRQTQPGRLGRPRLTDQERYLRSISEDAVIGHAMDLFQAHGWVAVHIRNSKRGVTQGDPGTPDITAARKGRVLFAECKDQTGKLSPDQERWRDELTDKGFRVGSPEYHLWRPSDMVDGTIERVIR